MSRRRTDEPPPEAPTLHKQGGIAGAAGIMNKIPPHDLDAEAAVLSDILLTPVRLAEVAHFLLPEHFFVDANRLVFAAILALEEMGMGIDATTVAHHLRAEEQMQRAGGVKYLADICDATPAVANISTHARIVFELWRARRMIRETMTACAAGYSLGNHADRVPRYLEESQARVFEIGYDAQRSSIISAREGAATLTARLQADGPDIDLHGLPTGFIDLDKVPVRLAKGNVTFIGGRPGMGKTAFATQLAMNAAAMPPEDVGSDVQTAVGVFSLEQPADQLVARSVCQLSGANLSRFVSGDPSDTDFQRIISGASTFERLPLWIADPAGLSLTALRAKVRLMSKKAAAEGTELRVIVIDYIQLMSGRRTRESSREQELSEISRGLKELAKEMRLHVVVLCQLNREVERRSPPIPMLSDLRESGSFEQDADTILLLYRPEYYAQKRDNFDLEERDKGVCKIIVSKNRHGPEGTVRLRWIPSCIRFANLAQQEFDEVA